MDRGMAALLASMVLGSGSAFAYESESAVPLTIVLEHGGVAIERIALRLHGREAVVSTRLQNNTERPETVAFYASTPVAGQLGEGEAYLDKRFADLRVLVRGQPQRLDKHPRAYFLGKDITRDLITAGIDPAPTLEPPPAKAARLARVRGHKPLAWQGSMTYSWADRIAPGGSTSHDIRYRDLPQFALEEIGSARFSQRIEQHCGSPKQVVARIKAVDPDAGEVQMERHEFVMPYMAMREVTVEVTQPARNWLGGRPLVSLLCGIPNPDLSADIQGVLPSADREAHVLVISLAGSSDGK